eukprot:TRINITY_DN65677_c3_g4_i2.p1 TRINITY_DN65677_c3_g4~~TRINITY_DN65677_c3_g4_i2.p1  ORF type:complete len:314 (+),score=11.47 TRINITY_DN65677_c3_g4_i2:43-984(+)
MAEGSLLVVILDLNPIVWTHRQQDVTKRKEVSLPQFLNQLLFALHAFVRLTPSNTFTVVAADDIRSSIIFPSAADETTKDMHFDEIKEVILKQVSSFLSFERTDTPSLTCQLSKAFSLALCHINKWLWTTGKHGVLGAQEEEPDTTTFGGTSNATPVMPAEARILTFSVTPDVSIQYISIMNAIFSSAKLHVVMDGCVLGENDSAFLQQATHITNGLYWKLSNHQHLQNHLVGLFLTPQSLRSVLPQPEMSNIDLQATCFCHKQTTSTGWVCSVCFSIFCKEHQICPTCKVKIKHRKVVKQDVASLIKEEPEE